MDAIKVSSKQLPHIYINDAKRKLESSQNVELSALESGIPVAVKAANALIGYGYAKLARFETSLIEDEKSGSKFKGLAKVSIKLEKAPGFDSASQEFEKKKQIRK